MKVVAVIQARMGSTRLPGKVLRRLGDRSVLAHAIARVHACPLVDSVIVATTTLAADTAIAEEAARLGVGCHRGSEADVLERYHEAAQMALADVVVRVTSDCPLFDPEVLTRMLETFRKADPTPDYLSNTLERSFPRGLDAEIFTRAALDSAHVAATQPHEREHVTPYLYGHPEAFTLHTFKREGESLAHLRWTLDTEEDWEFMTAVFKALPAPNTAEVLALLEERPGLIALNAHVEQKRVQS